MTDAARDAQLVSAWRETGDPAILASLFDHYAPLLAASVTRCVPARLREPGLSGRLHRDVVAVHEHDSKLVEDMYGHAREALLDAMLSFDTGRGGSLGAYARWRVLKAAESVFRSMRYPDRSERVWRAYTTIKKAAADLRGSLGRKPGLHEVAEAAGHPLEVVAEVLRKDVVYAGASESPRPVDEIEMGDPANPQDSLLHTESLPYRKRAKLAVLHALKQDETLTWDDIVAMLRDPDLTPIHFEGLLAELHAQAVRLDTRVPDDWERIVDVFSAPPPKIESADAVKAAYSRWFKTLWRSPA